MIVAKNGTGDFDNLQAAIDSIPEDNKEPVVIHIKNGVYKQKVHITKPNITLIGENQEKTILTFDDYALKLFPNGEKYGTFNSYSTFVSGNNFKAENITFENSSGSGSVVGQALAIYIDADRVKFKNCRFLGYQDTIFTGPLPPSPIEGNSFGGPKDGDPRIVGRQYFEDCYIRGDVDFIFGSATAVFNRCEIYANDRNAEVNGYLTAASTPEGVDFGYVFIDCKLTSDAVPNTVYLGRPWRDYAKTVFINCYMGAHIKKEGWHNWNKPKAEECTLYSEYNSYGPGATLDLRAPWSKKLTCEEAKIYSVKNILSGNDNWNAEEF